MKEEKNPELELLSELTKFVEKYGWNNMLNIDEKKFNHLKKMVIERDKTGEWK